MSGKYDNIEKAVNEYEVVCWWLLLMNIGESSWSQILFKSLLWTLECFWKEFLLMKVCKCIVIRNKG